MKIAAFTLVHNERFFLPLWLRYYSQVADVLHVFDHASTDGSVQEATRYHNFTRLEIEKKYLWKYRMNNEIVKNHFAELIRHYDWVIFSDSDEFLIPDPDVHENLRAYIETMGDYLVWSEGYNVLQGEDAALDFSKPILEQRMFIKREPLYDKPLIFNKPLNWKVGCHGIRGSDEKNVDESLKLFHLKYVDYTACYERYSFRFPKKVSRDYVLGQMNSGLEDAEPIPERFKGLL